MVTEYGLVADRAPVEMWLFQLRRRRPTGLGFTFVEVAVVVAIVAILATIAVPSLQRLRESAAVRDGRYMVTSALFLARSSAAQWGTTGVVRIDTAQSLLRVVVDTGSAEWGEDTVVVREFLMGEAVELGSDRSSLCFNSRGVGTSSAQCPGAGARIVLTQGTRSDTLEISSVGRVRR